MTQAPRAGLRQRKESTSRSRGRGLLAPDVLLAAQQCGQPGTAGNVTSGQGCGGTREWLCRGLGKGHLWRGNLTAAHLGSGMSQEPGEVRVVGARDLLPRGGFPVPFCGRLLRWAVLTRRSQVTFRPPGVGNGWHQAWSSREPPRGLPQQYGGADVATSWAGDAESGKAWVQVQERTKPLSPPRRGPTWPTGESQDGG